MLIMSKDELKMMLETMFSYGELWGVDHSPYIPTNEQHQERLDCAMKDIFRRHGIVE